MIQPNFNPFPELTTERLLMRRIGMEDAPEIFFLRSDQRILKFLGREPAQNIKEAVDFIKRVNENIDKNEAIIWAITLKNNPAKAIGTITFWQMQKEHHRAELGYVLSPEYWRKGIMKEAIIRILEYGFTEIKLHSVEARLSPENIASSAVLEATGFVKEAHFREDYFWQGRFEDTAVYSRLR